MASDGSRVDDLRNLAQTPRGNLKNIVALMFLLPIYEFFRSSADAVQAIFGVVINPMNAFSAGLQGIIDSILSAPSMVLDAGAAESARSLTTGIWAQFGPFTLPVAFGVLLLTAYMYGVYTREEETSNWMPFAGYDIPLVGNDEEGGD